MTESLGENSQSAQGKRSVPRSRLTTAGRLLLAVHESESADLAELAKMVRVPVSHLEECRDGERTLDLDVQILLAAAVLALAPSHERIARQLHAQAQSALRVAQGAVSTHPTYQRISWK